MKKRKRFIIVLHGPSCAGKTSVVEVLISRHENLFRISPDKIKWLISKYNRKKHYKLVNNFLINLAKEAISEGFSLVIEEGASNKITEKFRLVAKKNKMDFFEFNIEAPYEITKERFKKRLEQVKKENKKISNKSVRRLKEIYGLYQKIKNEKENTFDSSKLSSKQIVNQIEKIIF